MENLYDWALGTWAEFRAWSDKPVTNGTVFSALFFLMMIGFALVERLRETRDRRKDN